MNIWTLSPIEIEALKLSLWVSFWADRDRVGARPERAAGDARAIGGVRGGDRGKDCGVVGRRTTLGDLPRSGSPAVYLEKA